jgi:hypothetical protein
VLDATGVGAVVGVPADVAGTAMVVVGAGLALHGGMQTGNDLGNLISESRAKSSSGDQSIPPRRITGRTGLVEGSSTLERTRS